MSQGRTLVVTNDFPPRQGGIQSFVHGLVQQLPPDSVTVYSSTSRGAAEFDRAAGFEVVRDRTKMLLPDPRVARRTAEVLRATGCDRVLFGAAAPLGLLAPGLRRAGAVRAVGITHGHEAAWAQLPGSRATLRRIGRGLDTVTFLGEYTRGRIAAALEPRDAAAMRRLVPGVDREKFRPDVDGSGVRARHGLGDRPVVVCVSRLMRRKGQDVLIEALPQLRRRIPDAALLIVGGGPYRDDLTALAARHGVGEHVVFTGAVPFAELADQYAAGDVFAMPCRTRRGGLDVEGLGIVYLEASAVGLPVVAGDSGGAPDAVLPERTGYVVSSRPGQVAAVVDRLALLLEDRELAARLGRAGREWIESDWGWERSGARLRALLDGVDPDA